MESYVFRRSVCAVSTNSTNKTFATFAKALRKDRYLESIEAHFLGMSSYRRFPDDEEFSRELVTRDLYTGNARRSYWLRRFENFERNERVLVDEYTIEHILPQNDNLSPQWKIALGPEWERIRNTLLHTIGNLTLTGYNSEYSDRPFTEKRDMKGGFKESPLRLNEGLRTLDQWNEDTIRTRAAKITEKALRVWPTVTLPASILARYKPKADLGAYSLQDHPYLISGAMHEVFDAFRKEVLALDSCVTEEIFKTCIAYKAETNFVDLVPQMKRLQLTLNIKMADLDDPRHVCEDVSEIGHLGYGDVRILLSSKADMPYAMSLVRQSFERQMGNANGA